MKTTIAKLLKRYETDPNLADVLRQIDKAIKAGNLADLVVVLVGKDDSIIVANTCDDPLRALGALAAAQAVLNDQEDEA